jgi:hypothetical protein
MPPPPSIYSYKPESAQIQTLDESLQPAGKIWPSFVTISFRLPYNVNGIRIAHVSNFLFLFFIQILSINF